MHPPGLTFPRPFRRSQQHAPSNSSPNAAVIATNSDATLSKASCVRAGYYQDDFLRHFVVGDAASSSSTSTSTSSSSSLPKRPPLINRGYFCRHAAVSGLVLSFLSRVAKSASPDSPRPRAQVVSLGAGSDTLFFRLKAAGKAPALYVELDLPEVVSRKAEIIASTPRLAASVGLSSPGSPSSSSQELDRIVTESYALLPCDLRSPSPISNAIRRAQQDEAERSSTSTSSSKKEAFFFDPSAPTLFVSECVLVYLPPSAGDEVLRDALSMLSGSGGERRRGAGGAAEGAIVMYDPCKPETAFGKQMATNLRARGCELLGIEAATDPEGAAARLRRLGWENSSCGEERRGGGTGGGCSSAADLGAVWGRLLPPAVRDLASRIERLDELEEFDLIMGHYFLAVGVKKGGGNVLEGFGLASLAEEGREAI